MVRAVLVRHDAKTWDFSASSALNCGWAEQAIPIFGRFAPEGNEHDS